MLSPQSLPPWLRSLLAPSVTVARRLIAWARLPRDGATFLILWVGGARGPGIAGRPEGRTVVMTVVSDLRVDPRVEREARALVRAGYDVVVIWPDLRDPARQEPDLDWGPGISFRSLHARTGRFVGRYPGFLGHAMAKAALDYRPFAYHAHDLTTVLIGMVAARRTGAHLICDFHEWYSENVTWNSGKRTYVPHPPHIRRAYRWLESLAIKNASAVITVCEALAREMEAEFGDGKTAVHVVRNIPDPRSEPTRRYRPIKEELGIAPDKFLLLWQGGVGPSRMIEPIIEALPLVENCVLVIRGPGLEAYGEGYRLLGEKLGVSERLHLLPPVPSRDVVSAAMGADAGIWTLPNLCKNFYYALPNKIFEYLAAGLPVLAADFPEVRKLLQNGGVGLCFDPYDPKSIAGTIRTLANNLQERSRMNERIPPLLKELSAESEWWKVVRIYDSLRDHAPCRGQTAGDCSVSATATSGTDTAS